MKLPVLSRFPALRIGVVPPFAIACAFLVAGCTTSVTSRPMTASNADEMLQPPENPTVRGIPYFLPRGVLEVSIESVKNDKAGHKEFAVTSTSRLVPDLSKGYLLESPEAWWGGKTHEIKLKEGLLTLVTTEDENKIGEIVSSLLSSAANIITYGAAGGAKLHGLADMTGNPTREELAEIYDSINAGKQTFGFSPTLGTGQPVPGTSGLLEVAIDPQPGSFGVLTVGNQNLKLDPPRDAGARIRGIYTRVLAPLKYNIQLRVPLKRLYERRVTTLPARVKVNEAKIEAIDKAEKAYPTKVADVQGKIATLQSRLAAATGRALLALQEGIEVLQEELDALEEAHLAAPEGKKKLEDEQVVLNRLIADNNARLLAPDPAPYVAATQAAVAMIPNTALAVEIPITKAWMGISKNTVTLESGILTEIKIEKDSPGLALVKILYDATGKLVELPTKIVQFKIDYSKKEKELLDAQKALSDLEAEIDNLKEEKSDHDLQVEQLTREKQVLELEKQIAELKSQIAELAAEN